MCDSAGFDGHFYHFLCATSATRLLEAKKVIMQRTGHASSAVRAYKCVGENLKAVTSDVLDNRGDIKDEPEKGNEDSSTGREARKAGKREVATSY